MEGFSSQVPPILEVLLSDAHIRPKRMRASANQMVVWRKPNSGWIKLNVDGSCRANLGSCGGGGILRDHKDSVRISFSKKLEASTNNGPKFRALISGVKLGKSLGFRHIHIESNSALVVGWITMDHQI